MITINKQPQKFTPVNNPIIFQISSDTTGLLYFKIEIRNEANAVISNLKFDAMPGSGNSIYFELSETLKSYVDTLLVNSDSIIEPVSDLAYKFRLKITEWYSPAPGLVIEGDVVSTGLFAVWAAGFNRIEFHNYNYTDYALTSTGSTQFLSGKAPVSNIFENDTEYLYVLNDAKNYNVHFNFYGSGHTLLGSHIVTGITSGNTAYWVNVSPVVLDNYFGDLFANMYGGEFGDMFDLPFGTEFNFNSTNYYTVQIIDSDLTAKSELKTYVMRSSKCSKQSFQLFYSNHLGGYDSIRLFAPKESIDITRTTIKYSPGYSDITAGIFNETTGIINTNSTSTYKAVTGVLSDPEAKAVKDIIKAKKVYLKLSNDLFMPVSITNSSYSVQQKKYSTNNNRVNIEFTSDDSGLFD